MDKSRFLALTEEGWNRLSELLAEVPTERMETAGVEGTESVKDIVAHITWYERETAGIIESRALAGSDLWDKHIDERNAAVFTENNSRTLDEVLTGSAETHRRMVAAFNSLSEEELADANHFAEMPVEWLPWQVFASNSYEHYDEHIPALEAWLRTQK